ncbi:hypothetical protein N781_16700 [Pontibacillus halophilus JSM 076056 = DSM 19796]|uniref:RNA polymerase sigma factor n=1 Tax=Pontibacillus halophilus JSM 076056 = DSM 19796 TaxID=1385510 RepID=A0A0A5GKM9_9BACI|nr:sigma-70 family RNA polymerase sigma factor [Pontibacillus halophilus]KGX92499.1 hypothetical protein N781_16700 [Pontibacillus halophilus JSM 076056 = DSM 19796]
MIDERCKDTIFSELYETYYDKVYASVYPIMRNAHLAEEVTQDSFLKAYKKLHYISDYGKVGAWLKTLAKRTAIDTLRKEQKVVFTEFDESYMHGSSNCVDDYQRQIELHLRVAEVQAEARQLRENLRQVFLLKYKRDLKENEIAEHLKLSQAAVKSRVYRARETVKENLLRQEA